MKKGDPITITFEATYVDEVKTPPQMTRVSFPFDGTYDTCWVPSFAVEKKSDEESL